MKMIYTKTKNSVLQMVKNSEKYKIISKKEFLKFLKLSKDNNV